MEEKELFENYEHKVWEWTPQLYKLIALATTVNLLGILVLSQFNIFSTRGCDTPYVGIVCQAMDSAYIASVFYGKGFEADSRAYEKTEISDDEVVTIIDVTDQLKYPDGYFALANPETSSENPTIGDSLPNSFDSANPLGTTQSNKPDGVLPPQVLPTPNKSVSGQEDIDSPFRQDDVKKSNFPPVAKGGTPKPQKHNPIMSNESPKKLDLGDKTATKQTPKPTPSPTPQDPGTAKEEFNEKFNKKPLQDFADGVLAKLDSPKPEDKVDLTQNFTVVLDGTLTKEGKFDKEKTRFDKNKLLGNPQMVNLAKSAIEAMGDSNLFSYLQALGVDRVNITLVQDDKQISAIIKSNQPTEEKARTISSGFNGIIAVANMNTKDDADVQALLKATKFSAEGKTFVINFSIPKDQGHQLIDKKLGEARQKKLQPNSNEVTKPDAK